MAPLNALEIRAVTRIVRADPRFAGGFFFETIELKEPAKASVRAFKPGNKMMRGARVNLFEGGKIGVWRLTVCLGAGRVTDTQHLPAAKRTEGALRRKAGILCIGLGHAR